MIENPFLNNKNLINYHDDNIDTIIYLDMCNIAKYFNCVYILVKRNNKPIPVEFYDRQITSTVINHLLKINSKPLFYDELFTFVKKSIILFELDDLIFTKTIDNMIKQDYIRKLDNEYYEKIIY